MNDLNGAVAVLAAVVVGALATLFWGIWNMGSIVGWW